MAGDLIDWKEEEATKLLWQGIKISFHRGFMFDSHLTLFGTLN